MIARKVLVVFRKEVRESLRDRRTLTMMVMIPILLYPVMFVLITQLTSVGRAKLLQERSRVSARGALPRSLDSLLASDTTVAFCHSPDPAADLASRNIWAWLDWRERADSAVIYYDGAKEKSRLALSRLREVAERYRSALLRDRLSRVGIDSSALEPFGLRAENTAPPSRMGGMVLGIMLPILLIVSMLMGAMYPAMDLTAGEKERGTMETVLAAPVDKRELFMGKFLTVTAIAVITGALNLFSMMMTFSAGLIQLGAATGRMEFSLSPVSLALIFLSILPLAMFVGAVLISASLFARSFKDAQNLVTPVYLPLILLTQIAVMPGIQLNRFLALVPVANVTLLFKEIMLNEHSWGMVFLVFAVNSALALLAVTLCARLFGSEEILLGEGPGWQLALRRGTARHAEALSPSGALVVYAVVMLLVFYLGSYLQIRFRQWGVLATLWGLILIPALIASWRARLDMRKAFHLGGFRPLSLVGTLLLCAGALGIAVWAGLLQFRLFPEMARAMEPLRKLMDIRDLGIGLGLGLFIFSLSPGICEELFFRGMVLSSLRRRLPAAYAVAITSLLFAVAHLNFYRLVPTFILGLYLSFVVYRTGSVYLSMLAHALNNGFAVVLLYWPALAERLPWLTGEKPFPPLALAGSLGLAAAGILTVLADTKKPGGGGA